MSVRPVFIPRSEHPYFEEVRVVFTWFPGLAKSQQQKSISSLHEAALNLGISPVLEISSKSTKELGVALSAFNLRLKTRAGDTMSVEAAFQGSKVFEAGGPFTDLYAAESREAKSDPRLRSSGAIIAFDFLGSVWPTEPKTMFYDWLWQRSLLQGHNEALQKELCEYGGCTDIAFNPEKSLNCQARSAAIFVGLNRAGLLNQAFPRPADYRKLIAGGETARGAVDEQPSLQL